MRVDGKFVDAEGDRPSGQYVRPCLEEDDPLIANAWLTKVLLYLLRRCYGLIYRLLSSSEPVSEELMPIVSVCAPSVVVSLKSALVGEQALHREEMSK